MIVSYNVQPGVAYGTQLGSSRLGDASQPMTATPLVAGGAVILGSIALVYFLLGKKKR